MNSPLDEIEYLARSEHRVEALGALAERPLSRSDLRALTGASSSTVGRMLGEFEARYWIERVEHQYVITPLGAFVAEGLLTLLGRMETEQALRDVMRWFPTDNMDFDAIRCLSEAEIMFRTESDPIAPIRRAAGQLRAGTRLRFLTTQVTVPYFESLSEITVHDTMTIEGGRDA